MKRYLGVLLAVVLLGAVVVAAACPVSATKQTGGTYQLDMAGTWHRYSSIYEGNNYYVYPAAGHVFAIFNLTLTNVNAPDLYLGNPGYFKLSTSSGTAYSYSSATFDLATPLTGVDHTSPGEHVQGQVAFEISTSDTPTLILYNDGQNWVSVTCTS